MKIFIIDKVEIDKEKLKEIIEHRDIGFVIGEGEEISQINDTVLNLEPDMIIFDLVKNTEEEYELLREFKKKYKAKLIRLSSNSDKIQVENSYRAGVDYFIYKPINEYEIKTIANKVKKEIEEMEKLREIHKIINNFSNISNAEGQEDNLEKRLNYTLLKLGIIGEKGSEEIRKIVKFMHENNISVNDTSIRKMCANFTDKPKNMEQKIRRAINIAMINIANLGIEDYMNDIFIEYSNTLFNFEQVKREMDYIRGRSADKGSINMKKFLSGVRVLSEEYND